MILMIVPAILAGCKKEDDKKNPVITWENPADISYGTLLGPTQLNATANVPGVLIYSPPAGTKLDVGEDQDLGVVFTPSDASSYNTATKTVLINVTAFGPLHDPSLTIHFDDNPYNHNMHITTDGSYYYTCNGGNYSNGLINKYTLAGEFVASYPIQLDMRSIMYNKDNGSLYVSGFESATERNIYKILNLATGSFTKLHTNLFDNYQSGTSLSYDNQFIYAYNAGTLKKYNLSDGTLVQTLTGLSPAGTGDVVVAVDSDYIYTWDSVSQTVYVYDLSGAPIREMTLPTGNFKFSLSFAGGILFVAVDGNYGTGTWYGYNIRN